MTWSRRCPPCYGVTTFAPEAVQHVDTPTPVSHRRLSDLCEIVRDAWAAPLHRGHITDTLRWSDLPNNQHNQGKSHLFFYKFWFLKFNLNIREDQQCLPICFLNWFPAMFYQRRKTRLKVLGGELKAVCSKCKKISTFRPYINIPSSLGIWP